MLEPGKFTLSIIVAGGLLYIAPLMISGLDDDALVSAQGTMSEKVYKHLSQAQQYAKPPEENPDVQPDYIRALAELNAIKAMPKLSAYERAQMNNYYGFIYYSMEHYDDAVRAYNKVLRERDIPEGVRTSTIYTLAQVNFIREDYQGAIDLMNQWLLKSEDPGPDPFIFIASAYFQLERYRDIIEPVERAMSIARGSGTPIKERWWLLLRFAYWELDDMPNLIDTLDILVAEWPREEYARQQAISYSRLGDEENTRAAVERLIATDANLDLALYEAAEYGGTVVDLLIAAGADVNAKSQNGRTPLHLAAYSGDVSSVEMLITAGSDVNANNDDLGTALHVAAQEGHPAVVEVLIAAGADVDARNETETTPLHRASRFSHAPVVELLIAAGADVNAKTETNWTALHAAAQEGGPNIVELLIAAGTDVNARNDAENTPLHRASVYGDALAVELLIAAGADVDAKTDGDATALRVAAEKGYPTIVELLIAADADVNAKGNEDWTPLHWAAYSGDRSSVEMLITAGADVNARTERNQTALHWAADQSHPLFVELLIAAGADVNARDETDWTPLHAAANSGDVLSVEMLITAGADVNANNDAYDTALYVAAQEGYPAVIEVLIAADADVDEKLRPFTEWTYKDVTRFLKKQGFKIHKRDGVDEAWIRIDIDGNEWLVKVNRAKGGGYPLYMLVTMVEQSGLDMRAWGS